MFNPVPSMKTDYQEEVEALKRTQSLQKVMTMLQSCKWHILVLIQYYTVEIWGREFTWHWWTGFQRVVVTWGTK